MEEFPPPAPSRRRTWVWAVGGLAIAALAVTAVQLWANLDYDAGASSYRDARTASAPATATLTATMRHADKAAAAAKEVDSVTTAELLSADDRAALDAAAQQLSKAQSSARGIGRTRPAVPQAKPVLPWDLFQQASALDHQTAALDARTRDQNSAARSLDAAVGAVDELGRRILTAAGAAVPKIEAASVDARFAPIIAMRKAAAEVKSTQSDFDDGASASLVELDKAVTAVRASADAERKAIAGPLYDARRTVEAYARSISGGVLLEFVWTNSLLGQGAGQSAAGTATWDTADGGTSHITLTNSVARYWPSVHMRALVTHEVGHAISAKCYTDFDWNNQHANEQWATAWAMSWGFSAADSGAKLYGIPPASLQRAAATCR